jgi:hypothetical protein
MRDLDEGFCSTGEAAARQVRNKMAPWKKPSTSLLMAIFVIQAGLAHAASPTPALPEPTPRARPNIAPQAVEILQRACQELANPKAVGARILRWRSHIDPMSMAKLGRKYT